LKTLTVQNVSIEGPGLLQQKMEEAGWQLDIRIMDQPGIVLPGTLDEYKALIILGGPMNVYEEEPYPYLLQVDNLIKEAVRKNLPVLGICLGGQLIAKALDTPVTRNPVEEIGWYKLRLTTEGMQSSLFAGLPEEFPVFQWHSDTFALPGGASHLAVTNDCIHQAFSYGLNIFALQFHLEVTPEIINSWLAAYSSEPELLNKPDTVGRIVAETNVYWEIYKETANRFLTNWVNIISGL